MKLITFGIDGLLDGSRASISFNDFSIPNDLRWKLWDEVILISEITHDDLRI